jgi:hypothetical protein
MFPANIPTAGFSFNQATTAFFRRQKDARDGRISPRRQQPPFLMTWLPFDGNGTESGRHVRELNRILLRPACQRNSLANPQDL